MRRRRADFPSPARPDDEPIEAPDEATRVEDEARGFVGRLRLRGLSSATIVAAVRAHERFGFGETRTRRPIRESLEAWRSEAVENADYSKGEQIARVREELAVLLEPQHKTVQRKVAELDARGKPRVRIVEERVRVPPASQAIARLEELLADLEGNRTPIKVDVAHVLSGAAAAVFGALDDARLLVFLERARERRRLAASVVEMPAPRGRLTA